MSIEALRDALEYDSETGLLTWKYRDGLQNRWNTRFAGKHAFTADDMRGYKRGTFNGKTLRAHRVAFAMVEGRWPNSVDHINGVKSDNRWINLREVTHQENHRNQPIRSDNTSGRTGVYWHKTTMKWHAAIGVDGKLKHLGIFTKQADAISAREAAEIEHDFDPFHGRGDSDRANRGLRE